MTDLRFIFFLLLVGLLVHLFNLLLELRSAIILIPLLLLLDLADAIIQVIIDDGCHDAKQGEFLDNDEVQVEGLFVLSNDLLLPFTLLLPGTADRLHCCSFSFSLVLSDLDLAVGQLLFNLLLDSLLSLLSFHLSGDLLTVDNEASTDFQLGHVANQMVTAVDLFGIGVSHVFDSFLALLFSFLLECLVLKYFVFLSLHPFDVHDLLSLEFEVIAALPIGFTLFVLLRVERIELLITSFNLLLNLVGCSQGLIFLSIRLLHFLSDSLNLTIKLLFLAFESLNSSPNLVLLALELFDLRFDFREAFSLGD